MSPLQIYISNHPVLSQLPKSNNEAYWTEHFLHQLSAYIPMLINSSDVSTAVIEPQYNMIYAGDFYGYLKQQIPSISYDLYWITMRLSGMNGPNEFGPMHTHLVTLRDDTVLNEILSSQSARQESAL